MIQLIRFFLLTFCLTAGFSASATIDPESLFQELHPLPEHRQTTRNIVDALARRHYQFIPMDDTLSSEIYDRYLEDLDPSRSIFYARDIDGFVSMRYQLDDDLSKAKIDFAYRVFNLYLERVRERLEYSVSLLDEHYDEFDFTVDEYLDLDREEKPWLKTRQQMDDYWRKRIKNEVLGMRLAKEIHKKTDPEDIRKIRQDIQDLLVKRYRNRLTRAGQTNSEDVFQTFMNAFTMSFDPHTQYFSPRASENFNITMSLSLEGIGAVLQTEDEFTRVISLITAGPAEKSGQLHPNDKIISVGQGTDGEMVDVIGWRVDEVVELIRGKKGTVVRLGVLPASAGDSGDSRYVTLVRNKVKIEEQSAKSEIVEIEQFGFKHKIGVIDIPTFYIDWKALQEGDPNYKSTHRDVARLLTELKQEGVEGIIIDLRNNGGGSLQEAQFLTGLFIDRGPTVQIRHKNNGLDILPDRDFRVAYEGPLAVMVNRLSASASEIFAGAIQDYQRGVIIGTQTFGKGTVQTLITLNRGQLKITQSKFYRISGESTQHQGVIPDIAYPEQYDPETIGESTLDDPLPWDKIQAVGYKTQTNLVELLPELVSRHKIRAEYNPDFEYMRKAITIQREQAKIKTLSLSESKRIERRQILDGRLLALENEKRQAKGLPTIASLKELDEPDEEEEIAAVGITTGESDNPDTGEGQDSENLVGNEMAGNLQTTERNAADADPQGVPNDKIHKKAPDELLIESGNILLDWVSMKQRTASKDGQADLRAL